MQTGRGWVVPDENENFERKVETRIPATDHRDFALPDGVPYFCIPESVAFYNPSVYERKPTFFSFILTRGDGTHAYGFALHVFEEFSTAGESECTPPFDHANGLEEPTLDLTFEETIDYLRRAKRPIRLRFLNARLPYENACQFAERLQALSLVSALQTEHENLLLPWVDSLRGAFAAMFAGIFRDYQKHIGVERRESNATDGLGQQHALPQPENYGRIRRQSSALAFAVQFDHQAFCHSMQATDKHRFLREFTLTQSFAGFINESIMGRPMARPRGAYPPLELFKECVHLVRESSDARGAIALLFKRNGSPAASMALDLPMTLAKANDKVAVEAIVGLREDFGYYSVSSDEEGAESSTKLTSIGVLPVTEPAGTSSAVDLAPTESPSSSSPSSPLAEKADTRNLLEVTTKQPGLASPEQEEGGGSGVVEATLEADP
ncbi:hypothetical protein BBJ28_00011855 [Nothophytophthora sp. Chile5]|nr:hypothetical protein BBJ28_00011855 [Nothophytophthora sp. Chile5]